MPSWCASPRSSRSEAIFVIARLDPAIHHPAMMRRDWHPLPAENLPDRLIVFDGVCVLCSRWVDFIIRRDAAARFRFVAIQTPLGRKLAEQFGVTPEDPESNVTIVDGQAWFKLDSVLVVLAEFPAWRWTRIAWL